MISGKENFFVAVHTEMDRLHTEMDKLHTEMDRLHTEMDRLYTEMDRLYTEMDMLHTVRNHIVLSQDELCLRTCRCMKSRRLSMNTRRMDCG
jgi:predicted nuclease with TOPRIM domain